MSPSGVFAPVTPAAFSDQDAAGLTGAQTPESNMTPQQAQQAIDAQWKTVGHEVAESKGGGLDALIIP